MQYDCAGAPVRYSVSVVEKEDGSLAEKAIDPGQVLVQKDYLASPDKAATTVGHQQFTDPAMEAQAVMSGLDCASCHKTNETSIGPSFMQVSEKYKGQKGAVDYLAGKIISGGSGVWGEDRKRVVWGKSGSVRVDIGGRRIIKKKKKKK